MSRLDFEVQCDTNFAVDENDELLAAALEAAVESMLEDTVVSHDGVRYVLSSVNATLEDVEATTSDDE